MTRCLTYLSLLLLIVTWNVISMAATESDTPKTPTEATTQKAPAEAPTKDSTESTVTKTPSEPTTPNNSAEVTTPKVPDEPTTPKTSAKPSDPATKTYTVKILPFKITVELDGLFESRKTDEIVIKPKEWSTLTVLNAVPHGTQVKEGDILIKLDTDKLDQAISDLQTDQKLGEVTLQQAEDQLQALEKTTPLDMEVGERNARIAEEDKSNFFDTERPFYLKATEFGLKDANNMLEYQEDEYRQLEKMYKSNDITEETEQIVLKRAKDAVERAKFQVDYTQLNHDHMLKYVLPRMENQVKDTVQHKTIDWGKNKIELPLTLQKQRFELEKLKIQRERSSEKLKKLLADRELMVVKSPIDGVVYYGKSVRGKFSDSTNIAEHLRPYENIQPNQVVMTVVQPQDMYIRAAVPEEQLHNINPGLQGKATPNGYSETRLAVVIERLSDIPIAPGSFDARINLMDDEPTVPLMPGMGCKVKFIPYFKKEAITIPSKILIPDDLNDQKQFVYVLDSDGKSKKIQVVVGKRTNEKVEILTGLSEGDQVLLEAPKN